jgi:hypothetical protein
VALDEDMETNLKVETVSGKFFSFPLFPTWGLLRSARRLSDPTVGECDFRRRKISVAEPRASHLLENMLFLLS